MAEAAARRGREMERNGGRPTDRLTQSFHFVRRRTRKSGAARGEREGRRGGEREGGPTKPFSLPLLFKSLSLSSLLLHVSLSFVPLLSRSTVADFSAFETDPPSPRRRPTDRRQFSDPEEERPRPERGMSATSKIIRVMRERKCIYCFGCWMGGSLSLEYLADCHFSPV